MAEIKADYDCAQNVLYSTIELLWERYLSDVDAFHDYKESYSDTTASDALDATVAADELPDAEVQKAKAEEIGADVLKLSLPVLDDFQRTKGYINSAFAKEYQHANYVQAGQNHYAKAANKDWESVKSLGKDNLTYISDSVKGPLLEANNNMPTTFVARVTTNNTNFNSKYTQYKTAKNTTNSTDAKLTANNTIYATTKAMLADAAIVFNSNPTKAAQYIWETAVQSVDSKVEGLRGKAIDSVSSLPVPVTIIAKKEGKPAVSFLADKNGKFSHVLESGNYVLTISAPQHITQTINKEVLLHTMSRLNISMVAS